MGNLKTWVAGAVLSTIVTGLLVLVVSTYFRANVHIEVKHTSKLQKTQPNNLIVEQEHSSKLVQMDKDMKVEMEWMRKHQMEAKKNEDDKQKGEKPGTEEPKNKPDQEKKIAEKKTVYLTFDDGPQVFSKEIIALLEQYQVKATFFMLEGNIKRYPDAVNLMVDSGHAIGIHGVTHDSSQFYASAATVLAELDQTRQTIREITGIDIFLMRTPYGSKPGMTDAYKQVVFDKGYLMWDWTIDSLDWYYKDARLVNSVIEQIQEKMELNEPLVILLHEKRETLEQLPSLLEFLSQQHFECKTIDSAMEPIHF